MSEKKKEKTKKNSGDDWLESYLDVEEKTSMRSFEQGTYKSLLSKIMEQRVLLVTGVILSLVSTCAVLLQPRLFAYAIDEGIVPKKWENVEKLLYIFVAVELFRVVSLITCEYLYNLLGQRVMHNLRMALFRHMQRLPVAIFDKYPPGKLVTRVTNDVSALADMFTAGFVTIIGNVMVIFGTMAGLVWMNVKLGLIAICVMPLLVVVSTIFSKRLAAAYRDQRSKLSALNAVLAENILGMRVIHLFSRQKIQLGRFLRLNSWYSDAQFSSVRVFAVFQPTINLFTGVSMAMVIWVGGGLAHGGEIKIGILAAFFAYVMALFQPAREIADKWNVFLSGLASAERIFSILRWEPESDTDCAGESVGKDLGIKGHIVFENVWFAYGSPPPDGEPNWVLKDFSIEIKPGMKVGIVGPTGAGKTTLIHLLLRFYEPQKGRVLLDGRDITDFDKRTLRSCIGMIQQDVFLFSGSIADNVSLGRTSANGEVGPWLERWIAQGGMTSFSQRMDLPLQERGNNLSVGEKQTIAFARAAYLDPSIWILDEATANVDSDSEQWLEQMLTKVGRGRTSFVIAHRLASVRNADLILVLNKGLLVESGPHSELMKKNGLYSKLYRYQESVETVGVFA